MAVINPMDLTGRTFLVTGASSGIGRDTACLLAALGAKVVAVGRDEQRLQQTLATLQGEGHIASQVDLSIPDSIGPWFASLVKQTGPLHGFVHAAGIHLATAVRMLSVKRLDEIMRTNVYSAFMLARAFRQRGCYASPGSIVFLSSVTSMTGEPAIAAYGATKAALVGLTKSLAMEFVPDGIRVNCVCPATVKTEMTDRFSDMLSPEEHAAIEQMHPLGIGSVRDVSHAIAFLLADTSRWITGTSLIVDGGYTAR